MKLKPIIFIVIIFVAIVLMFSDITTNKFEDSNDATTTNNEAQLPVNSLVDQSTQILIEKDTLYPKSASEFAKSLDGKIYTYSNNDSTLALVASKVVKELNEKSVRMKSNYSFQFIRFFMQQDASMLKNSSKSIVGFLTGIRDSTAKNYIFMKGQLEIVRLPNGVMKLNFPEVYSNSFNYSEANNIVYMKTKTSALQSQKNWHKFNADELLKHGIVPHKIKSCLHLQKIHKSLNENTLTMVRTDTWIEKYFSVMSLINYEFVKDSE